MPGDHVLRYGTNPHQASASYFAPPGLIEILNGNPSYINLLDILTGWQMTRDVSLATGMVSAASMKHCAPVGLAGPGQIDGFSAALLGIGSVDPATSAYLRARSSDWGAAYGDVAILFGEVNEQLATLLSRLVSDGIAASSYTDEAMKLLVRKKGGRYLVAKLAKDFVPPHQEEREVFGVKLAQERNGYVPDAREFQLVVGSQEVVEQAAQDLALAAIAMKYTVSNSIVIGSAGRTLSISSGQQSRILATKLACYKFQQFARLQSPDSIAYVSSRRGTLTERIAAASGRAAAQNSRRAEMQGIISLASDGFLPFSDNVDEAARHGVKVILEPEGAMRGAEVARAAAAHGITLVRTSNRYFYH
jgi:phosphoribosylaminoimidazolecarboxamide formyltransferase / IMP cyclohydrolase